MGRATNNIPGHPLCTEEVAQEVRLYRFLTVVKGLAFSQESEKKDWKIRDEHIWSKGIQMDI